MQLGWQARGYLLDNIYKIEMVMIMLGHLLFTDFIGGTTSTRHFFQLCDLGF